MKIFLTFDYELFFGSSSGSVEQCMLQPTRDLLELFSGRDVACTFFADVGYLIAAEKYPELREELGAVEAQIKEMLNQGHDVQLHIHPHWEKAEYRNGKWEMNIKGAYRLHDFTALERKEIIRKYSEHLEKVTGKKPFVFRAGGWCIQPFEELKDSFKEVGITIDTSVIPGDFMLTEEYAIDFRFAPAKDEYCFEEDVCLEDKNGSFTELPIASMRYSPLFFWRLYVLGRLFPARHKMIGDGIFLDQGGRKKRVLKNYSDHHVSSDGYFASKLSQALKMTINRGFEKMVVIGHPKGNTKYSLEQLKKFIGENDKKHEFTSFQKEFCK